MSAVADGRDELLIDCRGATMIMTINRPQARNAINHAVAQALATAMDRLDADPELRVGIITGAGGNFSAGLDLKAFLSGEPRSVEGRGFAGFTEAPPCTPLIAAVEGYALAGGCEMVLACDLVVAAENAVLGLPEVKRGLIAGSGGLFRLPRRIPPQIAMEHALTGDPLGAAEAERWGLVNRLSAAGGALAAAIDLAERIAANAPLAVRTTKQIVNEGPEWSPQEAWTRQRALLELIVSSADAREGSEAFLQKRPPVWSGK